MFLVLLELQSLFPMIFWTIMSLIKHIFLLMFLIFWLLILKMGVYFVTDTNINHWNMDYTDNLPAFLLTSMGKCVPFNTFLCITCSILSMPICFGKYLWTKFPLFMRSPNFLESWKNDLSSLWNVSDMMPSWNGEFSSKSKLILGLISCTFCEFCSHVIFCLMGCFGGLRSRYGWQGTSGIKGLLFTIMSFALFVVCMLFVFLASIWFFQEFPVTS